MAELRKSPGSILDIRGSTGGFGTAQARMVGRLLGRRTKVAVSYSKRGPTGTTT